jgi:hypothetical protein
MIIRKADEQNDYDKVWDIFTNVIGDRWQFMFLTKDAQRNIKCKHWFADYMTHFCCGYPHNDEVVELYYQT